MPQNQARPASASTNQKIIFVSGKGGVGKSLIAAGLARREASSNRRVLLVEIGDNSYYKDFFEMPRLGHDPIATPYGFDLAIWSGESCLREYVLYYLKLQSLYHLFFENKVMRALTNVAPGLSEIAILGKITSGIRRVGPPLDYDLIVVDSYATGHALALLEAPKGMTEAIGFGPMGHQSREIHSVLVDSAACSYLIVTLLEELPVMETFEFRDRLKFSFGIESAVIGNKVLVPPVSVDELKRLSESDPQGLGPFADYLKTIEFRQQDYRPKLESGFRKYTQVPMFFSTDPRQLVEETAEALRRA